MGFKITESCWDETRDTCAADAHTCHCLKGSSKSLSVSCQAKSPFSLWLHPQAPPWDEEERERSEQVQTPDPPALHQGKAAATSPWAALRAKTPACPVLAAPWGEVSGEGGRAGSGPVLGWESRRTGCRLPARHAVPSAPAAFSRVALQEDSCPVFKLRHRTDTTCLPDVPPILKPATPCVSSLCFMVSAASVTSSEDHLSERPST